MRRHGRRREDSVEAGRSDAAATRFSGALAASNVAKIVSGCSGTRRARRRGLISGPETRRRVERRRRRDAEVRDAQRAGGEELAVGRARERHIGLLERRVAARAGIRGRFYEVVEDVDDVARLRVDGRAAVELRDDGQHERLVDGRLVAAGVDARRQREEGRELLGDDGAAARADDVRGRRDLSRRHVRVRVAVSKHVAVDGF